jgi:stage II sporulation protein AA (anti-sigma F factor antagonist)
VAEFTSTTPTKEPVTFVFPTPSGRRSSAHPPVRRCLAPRRGGAKASVTTLLRLQGELDLLSAPDLVELLHDHRPAPGTRLIVDLSGVTFADCAGLRPLVAAVSRGRRSGDAVVLTGASRPVARVLAALSAPGSSPPS